MTKRTLSISSGILLFAAMLTSGCSSTSVLAANVHFTDTPIIEIPTSETTLTPTFTVIPTNTEPDLAPTIEETQVPPPTSVAEEMALETPRGDSKKTVVPTDENGLPVSHFIYGISGHKQYFKLGCEAAATRDWALYFGFDINEFEFQNKFSLSDNPEVGFVGSVNSKWGQAPPYAYGVHAGPVAQLLQEYGMPATAVKDYSLTLLKQQIASDRPVVVWVIGNVVGGIPYEYTAKDGQKVIVAAYEHVVIVTGYNETHIRYLNNEKIFEAPTEVFLNSWKVLGNMALIAGKSSMEQKMFDIYVGRQPVYTPSMEIFGYELLYRTKNNTQSLQLDGEKASSQVIFNTFIEIGIEKIIEDKLAFLQVDRSYLTGKIALPFPKEQIVMCIAPWVNVDDELLVSLEILRNQGYWFALEDHPDLELNEHITKNINILKLNIHQFQLSSLKDRVLEFHRYPCRLLADHVQTQEEYEACKEYGFDFYQGNFLSKPKVIHGRRLPARRFSLLKLLTCLYDPDVDMRELEELIRQDVSLSYRLLRMVNSAYYALDTKVESIRHALVILGLKQIRAWLTILAMSEVNDRSNTLMTTAMIRGKMCELVAQSKGYKQEDRYFTIGLLSILDAIMDLPMEEVLRSLPMTEDINQALLKHTGPMGEILNCVISYENGEWNEVESTGISSVVLRDSYLASIAWASEISQRIQI